MACGESGAELTEPGRRSVAERVRRLLGEIADGALARPPLSLRFWDGSELSADDPSPCLIVRGRGALLQLAHQPNQLGFARAWALGQIELEGGLDEMLERSEGLASVKLSTRDRLTVIRTIVSIAGAKALRRPPSSMVEAPAGAGRRHSPRRDERSVRHHYDISNDFHELVIGPSLVYSCAYFESPEDSLEGAQQQKLELICRKLRLRAGDRLLDIGCGWGSLLLHAVREHGVRGVGVTLSEPQARLARRRLADAADDVAKRCEIRVADYREVSDGPFDAIVSVGMYEHVGRAQLGEYVRTVERLLRPGGLFLNHGIARLWPPHSAVGSFVDRFIFPDGELHPVGELLIELQDTDLEVRDVESMREHYGLTLRRWAANLSANRERAIELVGAERERIWEVYLTGSARAFERGSLSIFQVLCARRGARHRLPLSRARLIDGRDGLDLTRGSSVGA
jgi:cyclopropane-fatty-acyl-phospholipid synthase